MFTIKTEQFEGPLHALLDLIEKRKLHISEVSLSSIADDFINYVGQINEETIALEQKAGFIGIAATLILIKSRSLLPDLELSSDEEQSISDLELRLAILKRIRETLPQFSERFGVNVLQTKSDVEEQIVFAPHPSFSKEKLLNDIKHVINSFPLFKSLPSVAVKAIISLEEMIENLTQKITSSIKTSFKSLVDKKDKINTIVGFMALLELVKKGIVNVKQDDDFADIEIESNKVTTPNYL